MANLTSKELSAIEDQLGTEVNAVKKYRMYAQSSTDQNAKAMYEQMASKHQEHYNRLLIMLN